MCRQFPEPISLCDFGGGFNTEKVHKYVIGKQAVQHIGERLEMETRDRARVIPSKGKLAGCFGLDGKTIRVTPNGIRIEHTPGTERNEEFTHFYCDEVMDQ